MQIAYCKGKMSTCVVGTFAQITFMDSFMTTTVNICVLHLFRACITGISGRMTITAAKFTGVFGIRMDAWEYSAHLCAHSILLALFANLHLLSFVKFVIYTLGTCTSKNIILPSILVMHSGYRQ